MEMKKCKECGKLFAPKSIRSQYCSDIHYRPCPVCGKPVEAKYLSDPARCCSKQCQMNLKGHTSPHVSAVVTEKKKNPLPDIDKKAKLTIDDILRKAPIHKSSRPTFQNIDEMFGQLGFGSGDENAEMEALFDLEDIIHKNYLCITYLGGVNAKFQAGHEYAVTLQEKNSQYVINALYDFNLSKKVNLLIKLDSKKLVNDSFTTSDVHIAEDGRWEADNDGPIYSI